MKTRIPFETLALIDELHERYAAALDGKDMDGWLATFSTRTDASYILNTAENVDANLEVALIMDDCRNRLEDRVNFVQKVWRGTYQDNRTRHFTQRTSCRPATDGGFDTVSNFTVIFTPEDTGRSEVFAAGRYVDHLVMENDEFVILTRQVVTDSALLTRYLVYPL